MSLGNLLEYQVNRMQCDRVIHTFPFYMVYIGLDNVMRAQIVNDNRSDINKTNSFLENCT